MRDASGPARASSGFFFLTLPYAVHRLASRPRCPGSDAAVRTRLCDVRVLSVRQEKLQAASTLSLGRLRGLRLGPQHRQHRRSITDGDTRAFVDQCSFDDARNVVAKSRHVIVAARYRRLGKPSRDRVWFVQSAEASLLNVLEPSALQAHSTMLYARLCRVYAGGAVSRKNWKIVVCNA